MAKNATERKKDQRERDKALNIKQINIRAHVDDVKSITEHAQVLLEKRLKSMQL